MPVRTHNSTSSLMRRLARPDAGFTAVEMAMVATVIAIIALLVLPIFRQRAEAAREAGVKDELASLAKAELLAEADTGIQIRLQDLDNGQGIGTSTSSFAELTPLAQWNGTFESVVPTARVTVDANWKGPYASPKTFRRVGEFTSDPFFRDNYIYQGPGSAGFIYVVGNGFQPAYTGNLEDDLDITTGDRYPVDPWGQPYIFYGQGRFPANAAVTESTFNTSVLYSLGPDGVAGFEGAPATASGNPNAYRRPETGLSTLGQVDDIEYKF